MADRDGRRMTGNTPVSRPANIRAADCKETAASRELLNGLDTVRLPLPRREFTGAAFCIGVSRPEDCILFSRLYVGESDRSI